MTMEKKDNTIIRYYQNNGATVQILLSNYIIEAIKEMICKDMVVCDKIDV